MPDTPLGRLRPRRATAIRTVLPFCVRAVRPCVVDLRFRGDASVLDESDGTLALWIGSYRLTRFRALPIDLAHFNALLDRLRLPRCPR
jgi:hypothetical protein